MPTFTSEEDYLESTKPRNFTTDADYAPPNTPQHNAARKLTKGQTFVNTAADAQKRVNLAVQELYYKMTGNKPQLERVQNSQQIMQDDYDNFYRHRDNPNRGWAAGGNFVGGVTHPGSMATLPLGGGATLPARAASQGAIAGLYEFLTSPGSFSDRMGSGLVGSLGGAVGSAGGDLLTKGASGLMGRWTDKAARHGNELSKKAGTEPGIGQLREYSGSQMSADQLRERGSNWPASIERHARHNQEVDGRKLKEAMGVSKDPKTSTALPKSDAKTLHEALSNETKQLWAPFYKESAKIHDKVWPVELWQALKQIEKHNSKLLGDSSAFTDDVVRGQLQSMLNTSNSAKLPRFTPEEYTQIVSELGNAQHRVGVLSRGEAPSYDSKAVQRVTEAFGAAKDSMRNWGAKHPDVLNAWETALQRYQDEIIPVRNNDILRVATDLEPKGRDITNLMGATSERQNYDQLRDLIGAYRSRGILDAADRLDVLDANSFAAGHMADGMLPVNGAPSMRTAAKDTSDVFSLLGDAASKITTSPLAKGWYFGDPLLGELADKTTKSDFILGDRIHPSVARGALSTVLRKTPIAASREAGDDESKLLLWLMDSMGSEDDQKSNDPGFQHGIGAATQEGVMGR